MSSYSRNRGNGFYLNLILCCLAVVLLLGVFSNISRPGDDFTEATEGTDPAKGYSIKYYLTGVRILNDEVPSSAEAGETVILVFAPLEGYEFHLQAQNVVVKNASYTYSEESNGYHVLTLTDFVGDVTVTITAAVVIPDPGEGFYPVMVDDYSCYEFVNVPEMMYPGKEYRIEARHLTDVDRSIPFYDSDSGYKIRAEQGNNVTYFYISDITANQDDYFLYIDTTHTHVVDVTANLVGCTMSSDAFEYLHPGASDLIYLTPKTGYVLPASVSVTGGASVKSWDSKTGELIVLRTSLDDVRIECIATTIPSPDPDPVSYPLTFEISNASCFKSVDIPSTVSPGEEYSILLEHLSGNLKWYYVSEPANCSFSYETVGNFTCFLISDVVGPVTINFAEHAHDISVTSTLTNCTISGSTRLEYHHVEDYAHFKVTAFEGYVLPDTINVTGASIDSWNPETGALTLIIDSAADITIECAAVQAYNVTWNLVGCTTNDLNTPVRVDYGQVYGFKFNSGYVAFPDQITVTGASYNWNPTTGKLSLSKPTGPVSVTIICETEAPPPESYNFELVFSSKQITLLSSRPDSVRPGDEVILEFTKAVSNAVYGYVTPTNCKYEVLSSSGDTLKIKIYDFTGDANVIVGSKLQFDIETSLENCVAVSGNPTSAFSTGTTVLKFEAEDGYSLPERVSVSGAAYEWLPDIGTLRLSQVSDKVIISISAVEGEQDVPTIRSYFITSTHTTSLTPPSANNPSVIQEGQSVQLVYTKAHEYVVFGSVVVTGADYSTKTNGDTLTVTLSNPVDNVMVKVGSFVEYPITFNLVNCSLVEGKLPVTVKAGYGYDFYFCADDGFELPDDVIVVGASYSWGVGADNLLGLSDFTGPVTVTIVCEPERVSYPLTFNVDNASCFSSLNIPEVVYAGTENVITLEHPIDNISGWYLPDPENCSLRYETVGNVTYFYITNVVGPVDISFAEHYHDVSVTFNLTGCTISGESSFQYWHSAEFYEVAVYVGWIVPEAVSVDGADFIWDPDTCELTIDNITASEVIITIDCEQRVERE